MRTSTTVQTASGKGNKTTRTPSLLLSPSKRRKTEQLESEPDASHHKATGSMSSTATAATSTTTSADIWKWTLSRDAVAPCFLKDVLDMRENGTREAEFFWLGRVPCRVVQLVGILVGVQVYDRRTVYTLDDGSAVLECVSRHPIQANSHPNISKPTSKSRPGTSVSPSKRPGPGSAKPISHPHPPLPPPPPEPVAEVGTPVRVIGRVVNRGRRTLLVDEICPCSSPNDEPQHWLAVLELHRTSYFASHLGPFVIPPPSVRSSVRLAGEDEPKPTSSDMRKHTVQTPDTESEAEPNAMRTREPETPSSGIASTDGSPYSVASSARGRETQSPLRLRHPSRLHTRDLTANTFRIYLKHYMDHVPHPRNRSRSQSSSSSRSVSPSPLPHKKGSPDGLRPIARTTDDARLPATPTKCYVSDAVTSEQTPRPSQLRARLETLHAAADRTPRASQMYNSLRGRTAAQPIDVDATDEEEEIPNTVYGFTLSHLRRVPELATLALRVVDAEARRRAREERKRAESGKSQNQAKVSHRPQALSGDSKNAKMKRLFRFAIRQLYEEGEIVLWDGPTRALPSPSFTQDCGSLWRLNMSTATNSTSMSSITQLQEDEGELSDPPPGEEAYIPLTPVYFTEIVERAIRDIRASTTAKAMSSRSQFRQRSNIDANGVFHAIAIPPGPTPAEIVAWLHRDMRWARVGEWAVKETLEWAKREGKVWCVGNGRWELCE